MENRNSEENKEKEYLKDTKKLMKDEIEYSKEMIKEVIKEYDPDDLNSAEVTENLVGMYTNRANNLEQFMDKPYFARIDFTEEGEEVSEESRNYIGKMTVTEKNGKMVVVDWRAPISSLYYDGRLGNVQYTVDGREIKGNLSKKRIYEIENGELESFLDVDVTANDELLKPYLSEASDNRLKNIISTIQAEQNKIIRAPIEKTTIVQGTAGSGKTTVALHRIAYLIYANADKIKPQNFLILAPNKFFLDYVSNVLPDLGINNVPQQTFEEFAKHMIGSGIKIEDSHKKLANIINEEENQEINKKIANFKSSLKYKELIDEYLLKTSYGFLPGEDLKIDNIIILSKEKIRQNFEKARSVAKKDTPVTESFKSYMNQVSLLLEMNEDKIQELLKQRRTSAINRIRPDLPVTEKEKQRKEIFSKYSEFLKQTYDGGKILLKEYSKKAGKKNTIQLYKAFISSLSGEDNDNREVIAEMKKRILSNSKEYEYEDLAPLLYIKNKLEGIKELEGIKHIIVDEAQDYSEFQLAVMKDILKDNSMTILGDTAQGIYSYRGISNWDKVNSEIFEDKGQIYELNKSYRTTMEIMDVGNDVIDKIKDKINIKLAEPVIRQGTPVTTEKVQPKNLYEEIKGKVEQLKSKEIKNIAIIPKTLQEAQEVQKELERIKLKVTLISEDAKKYNGGVSIIPSYLSKGLEFDSVIIPNIDKENYQNNELDAKLLYISITRAMHTLDMYYANERTELLNERQKDNDNSMSKNIIQLEEER